MDKEMNGLTAKYKLSNYTIVFVLIVAAVLSGVFKWASAEVPVNFVDGDARDYYSSLISVFIRHDFAHQQGSEWYIMRTPGGVINVHPIGVSLLLLPFFLLAYLVALVGGFQVDGFSVPFQLGIGLAALTYAGIGLVYLKKLLRHNGISDRITAWTILLVFLGTNLLYYTVAEPAMSHVYSFALVSAFLYYSCRLAQGRERRYWYASGALLGLILLVRPNNVLVVFTVFIWFNSLADFRQFFTGLFRQRAFYIASLIALLIFSLQSMVWLLQSGTFWHNTYKADGFYWLHPQTLKMLFGFDSGLFVYTPLCALFLLGLAVLYRRSRFSFFAALIALVVLFYFFSCYWAYTYFDGIGIRVLVDYYAVFAYLGALFLQHAATLHRLGPALTAALLLMGLNLVYCYQVDRGIIYKAGMNFNKWKYVFLKTAPEYRNCLGGSQDFVPYAKQHPDAALQQTYRFTSPFDYSGRDFGVVLPFDSLGFNSNRLHLKIDVARQELQRGASDEAMICMMVDDGRTSEHKSYFQFKLNDTPAQECCDRTEYHYTANLVGNFRSGDHLSVYIWNINKQAFLVDEFAVKVYNYNYQLL